MTAPHMAGSLRETTMRSRSKSGNASDNDKLSKNRMAEAIREDNTQNLDECTQTKIRFYEVFQTAK